ncbi:MAG: lysylphosphatidylglycerol synthase domain-containing protein [Candidatus Omnitrophota bacterium]
MILNCILVFLALNFSIFICAIILSVLLNKDIKLWQAIKLICICGALNKFLLTGSGYLVISRRLKINGLAFYKSLSAFGIFELFSAAPWIFLGLYFGANIAIRIPALLTVFLVLGLIFAIYKRKEAAIFLKETLSYFKKTKFNIIAIIPLVLINVLTYTIYYSSFFRVFGVRFDLLDVLKIVSVAFTVGYLSPAPGGLGFKESGLIFLLMQKGLSLKDSLSIAITDRVLITAFYLILGILFGAEMIVGEIKKRFSRDFLA